MAVGPLDSPSKGTFGDRCVAGGRSGLCLRAVDFLLPGRFPDFSGVVPGGGGSLLPARTTKSRKERNSPCLGVYVYLHGPQAVMLTPEGTGGITGFPEEERVPQRLGSKENSHWKKAENSMKIFFNSRVGERMRRQAGPLESEGSPDLLKGFLPEQR